MQRNSSTIALFRLEQNLGGIAGQGPECDQEREKIHFQGGRGGEC
jgi:hypothetical protein